MKISNFYAAFAAITYSYLGYAGTTAVQHTDIRQMSPSARFPDLANEPLPPGNTLTKDYFQKAYPKLTASQLDDKWSKASASPMALMRSYVNVWYDDVAKVKDPGSIGPCFGDAHIDNFGYIRFADNQWHYTYNDLDDVGDCPVIFDALRYFTTLSLLLNDPVSEKKVRDAYIEFLNGKSLDPLPSDSSVPDYDTLLSKAQKKNLDDNGLVLSKKDERLTPAEQGQIFAELRKTLLFPDELKFLDIYKFDKTGGGSAAQERYFLDAIDADGQTVFFELKELSQPATEHGAWSKNWTLTRQDFAQDLWGDNTPKYLRFPFLNGKPFILRFSLKKSINLESLSRKEEVAVLTEEVYTIAQLHKKTIAGTPEYSDWLREQTVFMVNRYSEALQNSLR
ncbi:MAG: DUF2252 family protein [Chitinophagaceae bacterium]|nr:DUF2252 family protein [Oligoflexus sp.]